MSHPSRLNAPSSNNKSLHTNKLYSFPLLHSHSHIRQPFQSHNPNCSYPILTTPLESNISFLFTYLQECIYTFLGSSHQGVFNKIPKIHRKDKTFLGFFITLLLLFSVVMATRSEEEEEEVRSTSDFKCMHPLYYVLDSQNGCFSSEMIGNNISYLL